MISRYLHSVVKHIETGLFSTFFSKFLAVNKRKTHKFIKTHDTFQKSKFWWATCQLRCQDEVLKDESKDLNWWKCVLNCQTCLYKTASFFRIWLETSFLHTQACRSTLWGLQRCVCVFCGFCFIDVMKIQTKWEYKTVLIFSICDNTVLSYAFHGNDLLISCLLHNNLWDL